NRNGVHEIVGPGSYRTIEYNWLSLRVDFFSTNPAKSPVLQSATLRFIMRPEVEYAVAHDILLRSNLPMGGGQDLRTASQVLADIEELRASAAPFPYTDLMGRKHFAYISSIQVRALEYHERQDDELNNVEQIATINLVSVKV